MSALTALLWGIPAVVSFALFILLVRSQERFASVARRGWTRIIAGSALVSLFCVILFLLHLPVIEMLLGAGADWAALGAYLLLAAGLTLMIPAAVGWLSDLQSLKANTDTRLSAVSLTEDLLTLSDQPYVLTELLTAGLGTILSHSGSQAGMVWLLAQDGVSLVLAGGKGFDKPALKAAESVVASGQELFDRALKGRQVISAGDLRSRGRFVATFPGMDQFGSVAIVPLSGGGEIIGMALLAAREPYHFTPVLGRTLEGAGRVLGSAVAGQRLHRVMRKLDRELADDRRAVAQWDTTLGGSIPLTAQAILHGAAESIGATAAFLVPTGCRHIPFATDSGLVGLPLDGIWGEAVTTSIQRGRALWVNAGSRSNDPRAAFGRWVAQPTPAGCLFFLPRDDRVDMTPLELGRLARLAEIALLLAPAPEQPDPERVFELATRLHAEGDQPQALAEVAAELLPSAEAVCVWRKRQGRLEIAAAVGCDSEPLAACRLPVGQGTVGKAALAVSPLSIESSAELGRSWAEYAEEERAAFAEAFGGLERPAAEYLVPIAHAELVIQFVRFTRGGWPEASTRLIESLVRCYDRPAEDADIPAPETDSRAGIGPAQANELNNIFTGILGQAELLGRQLHECGLPALERERIERIVEAAQSGGDLVRRQAQSSDGDKDAPGLDHTTQELLEGRHITDDLYLLPDNRAIQIKTEFEATPPFAGDRQALQRVLWTALSRVARDQNAVTLGTSADDRYLYLAVDRPNSREPLTGPFGDFFRAPDMQWRDVLGLEELDYLRSHGAQIAADDRESPSRLVVRFPRARPAPRAGSTHPGLHVLAVDDQEIIRDLLLNMFMGMGHKIHVCASGEEGLRLLEEHEFDLVVTDLGMPGMSGWEVAQAVKERSPSTPVVLITGWGFNFAEEQVRKAGVDYVLTKPFRLEHLTEVVDAVVRRSPQVS